MASKWQAKGKQMVEKWQANLLALIEGCLLMVNFIFLKRSLFLLGCLIVWGAYSQTDYPNKVRTVVVPFPVGGSSDMAARAVNVKMGEFLGQSVLIDNKAGATGTIGAGFVRRAPSDGYTLMIAPISVYAINPALFANLPYDPQKDFDLLSVMVRAPNVLVTRADFPVSNLKELIDYMRINPSKVSFGSSGNGSSDHLTLALFSQKVGVAAIHVAYKGSGPMLGDLLGGQIDASFQNLNLVLNQVRAGKLKAFAITSANRSPLLPNVPTLGESGVLDVEVYSWQGAAAPKGLSPSVQAKLHAALINSLQSTEIKKYMTDQGFEIVGNTPQEFKVFLAAETHRWKRVVELGKIVAD